MNHKSIFVSSTFRDFQTERDLLQNEVEIRLGERMLSQKVSFVDLRWGIDTSQEQDLEKVVSICIAEVQNSRPYYVIMLGDTYGSAVDDTITEALYRLNGMTWDGKKKSVTEIEIEATGLLDGNSRCAIVLSRTLTGGEKEPAAEALKEKVLQAALPENVLRYEARADETGGVVLEDPKVFVDFIADRIIALLKEETSESFSPAVSVAQWEAAHFYGRETVIHTLHKKLLDPHCHGFFRIWGNSGGGLTAILAKLYVLLRQMPGIRAAFSTDHIAHAPLPVILEELAEQVGIYGGNYRLLFQELNPDLRYYFFIDDSDDFADSHFLHTLEYKLFLPENVTFILGTHREETGDFVLPSLSPQDAEDILVGTLTENKKEIPQEFLEYFRSHITPQMAASPFLLKSFITSLCYLSCEEYAKLGQSGNFMEGLTRLFVEKMQDAPQTEGDYFREVLQEISPQEYRLAGLLALSRFHISEGTLLRAANQRSAPCTPLHFYQLKKRLRENLRHRPDGTYELAHRSLEDRILQSMTPDTVAWLRYRYIQILTEDPQSVTDPKIFREVAAQLVELNDGELLAEILDFVTLQDCDLRKLGLLLSSICKDTYSDAPSQMYLTLAQMDNPRISYFLQLHGMSYLSDLYIKQGSELFLQLFETLYKEGQMLAAADAYTLYLSSLSLNMRCSDTLAAANRGITQLGFNQLPPEYLLAMFRVCCFRYDTLGGKKVLSLLMNVQHDPSPFALRNALLELIPLAVLLDGNLMALKEVFTPFISFAGRLMVDSAICREYPLLPVGIDYLCHALKMTTPCPMDILEDAYETVALNRDSLVVTLLGKYTEHLYYKDPNALPPMAQVIQEAIKEDSISGTMDFLFLCRFFRRVCLRGPQLFGDSFIAEAAEFLCRRLLELTGGNVTCSMQFVELTQLAFWEGLYAEKPLENTNLSVLRKIAPKDLPQIRQELSYFEKDLSYQKAQRKLHKAKLREIHRFFR